MVITLSVIIWWILIGLVVGAVARLVIPGRQHIGILVTILIGIVAAIVGGILTAALLGAGHTLITFIVAVLLAAAALIFGASILYETLMYGKSVAGYPSVIVGLMVLGGVQLVMIGVVGEYIGKILSEIKARPIYFVAEHSVKTVQDQDVRRGDAPTRAAAE